MTRSSAAGRSGLAFQLAAVVQSPLSLATHAAGMRNCLTNSMSPCATFRSTRSDVPLPMPGTAPFDVYCQNFHGVGSGMLGYVGFHTPYTLGYPVAAGGSPVRSIAPGLAWLGQRAIHRSMTVMRASTSSFAYELLMYTSG